MTAGSAINRVLHMPSLLLILGLGLGLLLGITFEGMEFAAMAALASLMTFSLVDVELGGFRSVMRYVPIALGISFLLHPALLILAGILTPRSLWDGWVLMAAVPPAISIVPFTAMLRGDVKLSVASTALLYVFALGLTPLIALLLLDVEVSPFALLTSVLVLILIPLLLSRAVAASPLKSDTVVIARNLSFGTFTYFVGAANQAVVVQDPTLAIYAFVVSALVVCLGAAITWGLLWRIAFEKRLSLLLFSGYKNAGLAATLAIALLGPTALVAPTMMILFQILWIALLTRLRSKGKLRAGTVESLTQGDDRKL